MCNHPKLVKKLVIVGAVLSTLKLAPLDGVDETTFPAISVPMDRETDPDPSPEGTVYVSVTRTYLGHISC